VFGSKSGSGDQGRGSAEGGNGNVRDRSNPDGARHAAIMTPHRAAVNDLRSGSSTAGAHRGE
jgi:hypothetical protein